MNDVMVDIPAGFETLSLVEALNGINPQLSYLTIKQSIDIATEVDKTDEVGKKDSNHVSKTEDDVDKSEANLSDYKQLDEEAVSFTKNSDDYNIKYFYKQKPKYVVAAGDDSVSASSSSSGNVMESIQEKTRLLTAQKHKPKHEQSQYEGNPDASQTNDCDPSATTNPAVAIDNKLVDSIDSPEKGALSTEE